MNFLGHVVLAGPDPADRLGAMLGDFVKGPLPAGLPRDLAAGVELHRRIDSFADAHPAFRSSRARVSAQRRRYAGIMVDLFYDHFLARHWARYCGQPLEEFTAEVYGLMAAHVDLLPPRLRELLPVMRAQDWMSSYRLQEAVGRALDNMARRRLTRSNTLAGAAIELEGGYQGFEQDFLAFFPEAQAFAATHRQARGSRLARDRL